jgi:hypothetical protein
VSGVVKLHAFQPDTARATQRITDVLIWSFALAYEYIPGSDTDAFKAVGIFAGLMIFLGGGWPDARRRPATRAIHQALASGADRAAGESAW